MPCDPLDIPSNGKAYFSIASGLGIGSGNYGNTTVRFSPGDAARFSCDGGFSLVGQNTIVCQTNGKWSATPPTCAVGKCEGGCGYKGGVRGKQPNADREEHDNSQQGQATAVIRSLVTCPTSYTTLLKHYASMY